jgi:hypothetical protein
MVRHQDLSVKVVFLLPKVSDDGGSVRRGDMKITKDSHVDHNLTEEHLEFIKERFGHLEEFFIETVEVPLHLPPLPCGLFGPLMGDEPVAEHEVSYVRRGDRPGESRIVQRDVRRVRQMTVIGGPHEGAIIMFTAYGGPCAPREPWDESLPDEEREESVTFWKVHALAAE